MNIDAFWRAVLDQKESEIRTYFREDAVVNWHCTNESFTVGEFLRANCEYPGEWDGEIERRHQTGELIITAVHVYSKDRASSFHVTSFIGLKEGKIASLDEYWADDGAAPQWRLDKHIGRAIK